MNIKKSQREMRSAFLGGFAGQLVSGLIWLVAAGFATWSSPVAAMAVLFFRQHRDFYAHPIVGEVVGRRETDRE